MSKIDHSRPALRYLDNLRRELSRQPLLTPVAMTGPPPRSDPSLAQRSHIQKAPSPAAYQRHIQRFDELEAEQQLILGNLINTYGALIEARSAELEVFLVPGKRRKRRTAAREKAQQEVSKACFAYHKHCRLEGMGSKSVTREWFRKLLPLLGPDRDYWEELEIIIKETR